MFSKLSSKTGRKCSLDVFETVFILANVLITRAVIKSIVTRRYTLDVIIGINIMKFKNHLLKASVSAAMFGLPVLSLSALSLADDSPQIQEVLVTLPLHHEQGESAFSLSAYSGDKLQRISAGTIGETLAHQPGIANASFGPAVGRPVIRGQSGARVLVLQNGMGSSDVSSVSPDHLVTVEPVLAQSVEVLRGPSTLFYSGAIGGVVNVIDNRIPLNPVEGVSGAAEYRFGSASDASTAVLSLDSAAGKNAAIHIDGLWRDSDNVEINGKAIRPAPGDPDANRNGEIANSDAEAQAYTLGGSIFLDNGMIGLAIKHQEDDYGIPPSAEQLEEGEVILIDAEQTRYDLRSVLEFDGQWLEQLRSSVSYTDYEHVEVENGEAATEWSNETTELRIEAQHAEHNGFHGVAGLQLIDREFAAEGEESYVPAADIQRLGVFAVEDYHIGDVKLEAGLRYDNVEIDLVNSPEKADFDNFSVSASLLWQFHESWRTGLVLSSSERAPEVEELYADGPHLAVGIIEEGDASLDSERAANVEWSLGYEQGAVDAKLTVYHKQFDDYIYLQDTGVIDMAEMLPIFAYTQQDADFTGVELELALVLGQWKGGEIGATLFGDLVRGELDNGDDIPRMPPQRVGLELGYTHDRIDAFVSVVDADRQDKPGLNERETAGYTQVDASVEFKLPSGEDAEWRLFLRGKNLGDEEIRSSVSFLRDVAPEQGRSVEAGARVTF